MEERKATLVIFAYDDGSFEYSVGDSAAEVMEWLIAAQSMLCVHGSNYTGRKMVEVPGPLLDK
jgi:hypothetical protein